MLSQSTADNFLREEDQILLACHYQTSKRRGRRELEEVEDNKYDGNESDTRPGPNLTIEERKAQEERKEKGGTKSSCNVARSV